MGVWGRGPQTKIIYFKDVLAEILPINFRNLFIIVLKFSILAIILFKY